MRHDETKLGVALRDLALDQMHGGDGVFHGGTGAHCEIPIGDQRRQQAVLAGVKRDDRSVRVEDAMKNALPELNVPILVETGIGAHWLEAH